MSTVADILAGRPLVAILRGVERAEAVRLANAVWDTGLGVVEVTIQTPEAVATLSAVAAAARERGEHCGAGTVVSADQVRVAAASGAVFTVAPGFDPAVAEASRAAGLPHVPGVATASEVQRALASGHTWLKVFPAGTLGPRWLREMRGPFPDVSFVATGGIDGDTAVDYLDAGAAAVGVGSAIGRTGGLDRLVAALSERNAAAALR
jgi:2-dehydro-3-deoxyphosphogluconate aldolase / (4S)-4-hydroxy-2-oxoglutarate aldolase